MVYALYCMSRYNACETVEAIQAYWLGLGVEWGRGYPDKPGTLCV